MTLDLARLALNNLVPRINEENGEAVLRAIDDWWIAYKDWERVETFSRAFTERRMTVRTIKYETVHTPLSMIRAAEPAKQKQQLGGISDTGITGLVKRLNPQNFVSGDAARTSSKYSLGLHDMSVSLLHPQRDISHQLYGWGFQTDSDAVTQPTKSYYVVFMPLAHTEDMALFFTLNDIAKSMRGSFGPLYQKLRDIKSEFTRIKYADKDDSHIGFVDVSEGPDPVKHKYRYGLSHGDAERGNVRSDTMIQRQAAARMYTGILETAQERGIRLSKKPTNKFYNEIIVAYRKHASGRFPLFTRWNAGSFQVVKENGNSGMSDVPGQTVSVKGVTAGF